MRTKREANSSAEPSIQLVDGPTFCDGCGKDIADTRGASHSEITIKAVLGDSFTPSFPRTITAVDCCKQCFSTRVYPALLAAGIKMRVYEEGVDPREWERESLGAPPSIPIF